MVPLKWGSRGVVGIRCVWEGVWFGRGEEKAPPHGNTYQEYVRKGLETLIQVGPT